MNESDLSAKLDGAWGDPQTWITNGLQWTHLEPVRRLINKRVSGNASVSPLAWFANHVAAHGALPLKRVLVLGCGAGQVERHLHNSGWASEIVAFDFSSKVLEVAKASSAGNPAITYVLADMNNLPTGRAPLMTASFDAVMGVSSVHHCANLPGLYAGINSLLKPGGWFFLDEYVGPDQFQYSDANLEQLNDLIRLLPDWLLTTQSGSIKRNFTAPTVAQVVAVDPSEAIASSSILPLLSDYFEVVSQRPYGGSLLRLLLADVAQNFQSEQAKPWLQALMDVEDDLDRLHLLEHHFSCVIARPRP